jgi:hypothetical protein
VQWMEILRVILKVAQWVSHWEFLMVFRMVLLMVRSVHQTGMQPVLTTTLRIICATLLMEVAELVYGPGRPNFVQTLRAGLSAKRATSGVYYRIYVKCNNIGFTTPIILLIAFDTQHPHRDPAQGDLFRRQPRPNLQQENSPAPTFRNQYSIECLRIEFVISSLSCWEIPPSESHV